MAAIYVGSSFSGGPDLPVRVWDKAGHALVYAGLSLFLVRALAGGWGAAVSAGAAANGALGATLYGLTDEWHQAFVPRRSADPLDLLADAVGAACAAAALYLRSRTGGARTI